MLRHDHEALLHGAIDNTLTLEERDALRGLLANDAASRQRFGELERLNALLASLGLRRGALRSSCKCTCSN